MTTGSRRPRPWFVRSFDACRTLGYRNEVSALLAEIVRDGHVGVGDRSTGNSIGRQRRRSALVRDVLISLRAGVVSGPEDDLFRRWQSA